MDYGGALFGCFRNLDSCEAVKVAVPFSLELSLSVPRREGDMAAVSLDIMCVVNILKYCSLVMSNLYILYIPIL